MQRSVNSEWLSSFVKIANHNNIQCILLPMPKGHVFAGIRGIRSLPLPLSPLDWYGLIKYSAAYVGHNMHPTVVAMHNNVPFHVFDYYGIVFLKYFVNSQSSKIYDLLRMAGMLAQRSCDTGLSCKPPTPETVFRSVLESRNDRSRQTVFSYAIARDYEEMMNSIVSVIEHSEIQQ